VLITSDSWATQAYNDPGRVRPLLDGNSAPSPFRIEATKLTATHGRFEIEPLEEGYGVTLGNALRRILLSSLSGAAITSVKIDGIRHEFSDIPHVREDVTELVLNLKKIRLKSHVDQPVSIELDVRGSREVTGADLQVSSGVEVVNPEQYIATLDSPDAELHAEMIVERGKRYLPTDQNESLDIGTIPIDAVFSPIRRVNYVIERKRVGPMTNFERLVLEIWTDGTMAPSDAMTQSAEILRQHFQQVADFGKLDAGTAAKAPSGSSLPAHIYDMLIEKLELTPRAYNSLKRANISKVGEVLEMSEEELLAVRNFGKKSLDELKDRLAANNLLVEASNSPLLQSSGSASLLGDADEEEDDQ
jgi:DNA-directed RNA polymerase subunit alpha